MVNINQENIQGKTPLRVAISNRRIDIVEYLLKMGASMDFKMEINGGKVSPLEWLDEIINSPAPLSFSKPGENKKIKEYSEIRKLLVKYGAK